MVAESSASRSLRPASKANPLAELHHRRGLVHMHGWRGQVETKRASGIRPGRKPNTRDKRQSRVCFRGLWLTTGDHNVVGCVGFAVGAEGAEGIVVRLAFVLVRPVPGIDTNHAR